MFLPPNVLSVTKHRKNIYRVLFLLPEGYRQVSYRPASASAYPLAPTERYLLYFPPVVVGVLIHENPTYYSLMSLSVFAMTKRRKGFNLKTIPLPNFYSDGRVCMQSLAAYDMGDLCALALRALWDNFNNDLNYGTRGGVPHTQHLQRWEQRRPDLVGRTWPTWTQVDTMGDVIQVLQDNIYCSGSDHRGSLNELFVEEEMTTSYADRRQRWEWLSKK